MSLTHLVLFDGACAVCNRAVQFLLDHDAEQRLHYAPLQGPTAQAILARHPLLAQLDTLVYVFCPDGPDETVHIHSGAVFEIAALLPAPARWLSLASMLPRPVADAAYRSFASIRYRVFGSVDACRIPLEHQIPHFHA